MSIHGCDPTTEQHRGFDLLRFRPGPVHPALDDLVVRGSPRTTISIPNLAWTPVRHSPVQCRTPQLNRTTNLSLPVTWIRGTRHRAQRTFYWKELSDITDTALLQYLRLVNKQDFYGFCQLVIYITHGD